MFGAGGGVKIAPRPTAEPASRSPRNGFFPAYAAGVLLWVFAMLFHNFHSPTTGILLQGYLQELQEVAVTH